MLNIAIIDDEIIICARLCQYLERAMSSYNLNISEYGSGTAFVNALNEGERYDIVFMDIQMAPMNGIEAGRALRASENGAESALIFISAHTDNLMPLFALQPLDFIEKPLEYGKFEAITKKIISRMLADKQYIFVRICRDEVRLLISDIVYAEIMGGRQVKIRTKDGSDIVTYERLSPLLNRITLLSNAMLQIHKSYFINKNYIISFNSHEVTMTSGAIIPISASFKPSVNKTLMHSLVDGGIYDEL